MLRNGDIFHFGYNSCCLDLLCHCASSALVIQEAQVGQGFQPTGDFHPHVGGFQPTSLFLEWSKFSQLKSEDQRSNWRIVSYEEGLCLGLLWWSSLMGARWVWSLHHVLLPFPPKYGPNPSSSFHHPKPTSSLALMTAVVSQWAIHYAEARIISFESKSDLVTLLLTSLLWLPIVLSPKFKLLTLTKLCMIGPLLLFPTLSQVPLLFLHSILASVVTFQIQTHWALHCHENLAHRFWVPRILSA